MQATRSGTDLIIKAKLKCHATRMEQLIASGIPKPEASSQAMREIDFGKCDLKWARDYLAS